MENSSMDQLTGKVPPPRGVLHAIKRGYRYAHGLQQREKVRLRAEILQVNGLMGLLMKPRNGERWTKEERAELIDQLRRISRLSLYLTALMTPGTMLTLPLLAWWLDRRRIKRSSDDPPEPPSTHDT